MITFDTTITFGAGAVVGALFMKIIDHRLAKSRDTESRIIKGFNEAAGILFNKLSAERSNVTAMYSVSRIEFKTFRHHLSFLVPR